MDQAKVADGTYHEGSPGFEGMVAVRVTVVDGKVTDREVRHPDRHYYSSVSDTRRQILSKSGVKGVDATSGATVTSEAIIQACARAMASGAGR